MIKFMAICHTNIYDTHYVFDPSFAATLIWPFQIDQSCNYMDRVTFGSFFMSPMFFNTINHFETRWAQFSDESRHVKLQSDVSISNGGKKTTDKTIAEMADKTNETQINN